MMPAPLVTVDDGHRVEAWIHTDGDPVAAFMAFSERFAVGACVWDVGIHHDDDCPAIGGTLMACTCELIEIVAARLA